ncbi:glutathione S-transferase [Coprinopsis cinerea AmutBmut pab1-1]|nr:glutathione S-transferase [Coprinopsis cinerea AmutBmut pab1-1]
MVLKLYGWSKSTCTQRVATTLHEKKVPFEFVMVDLFKGESKTPEYLMKQPFGQVPYLDDDGFILYESRAIARYIAEKYANQGTNLIPMKDLQSRALFEQAASIETADFDQFAGKAVFEMVFKPMMGGKSDQKVFDDLIATLSSKLDVYDKILAKQKYLAGNEITLADLFHLPYGVLLSTAGSEIMQSKPNVARWFNEMQARPSWKAVKDGGGSDQIRPLRESPALGTWRWHGRGFDPSTHYLLDQKTTKTFFPRHKFFGCLGCRTRARIDRPVQSDGLDNGIPPESVAISALLSQRSKATAFIRRFKGRGRGGNAVELKLTLSFTFHSPVAFGCRLTKPSTSD